jgi:hypothetical protein
MTGDFVNEHLALAAARARDDLRRLANAGPPATSSFTAYELRSIADELDAALENTGLTP